MIVCSGEKFPGSLEVKCPEKEKGECGFPTTWNGVPQKQNYT